MSKLVECPNCLGSGEEVIKGKRVKTCKYCKGDGMMDDEIATSLIDEKFYEELE